MKKTFIMLGVLMVSGLALAGCTYNQSAKPPQYGGTTQETVMKATPAPQNDTPETLESDLNTMKLEEETFQ